jgi:DNA-binding MarR family transcriptional regulator
MDLSDKRVRQNIANACTCFNLRKAARLVTQRFDLTLRSCGINANQLSVLLGACDQDGILLTRMAKNLGMERTTLSRNLSLLEHRGMLSIEVGADKRERRIGITGKGRTLLEKAFPFWEKAQNEVVELLGRKKWEELLSGLHEVGKKL